MDVLLAATDPNWLLSSVAQSAAALVAIIGGFLVSRLVSLAVDRNRLAERRRDLAHRLTNEKRRLDEVRSERLAGSTERFTDHHLTDVVEAAAPVEVDQLLTWIPAGSSEEEMRPVAEDLLARVSTVTEILTQHFDSGRTLSWVPELLRLDGVEIPADSEEVYSRVAQKLVDERSNYPKSPRIGGVIAPGAATYEAVRMQRQDRRIETERNGAFEVGSLEAQLRDVDEALRGLKSPDLASTVWVLGYLAVVGILLPVVLMAVRPVPSGAWARWIVVAAFASGLVVLLWHLRHRMAGLRFGGDGQEESLRQ